ncbi:Aldehyde/histidinol dehydrogenase, partial [Mycena galopus ATCC 62051]
MIIAGRPRRPRLPPAHPTSSTAQSPPSTPSARFVGGNNTGRHIYAPGAQHGKRVQCDIGAKNHAVVMPDAKRDQGLNALPGAACAAAGQRCMSISVAVFIGAAQTFIPELVARAGKLKGGGRAVVSFCFDGPVTSPATRPRIEALIASAESASPTKAKLLLEARRSRGGVPAYPDGNFVVFRLRRGRRGYTSVLEFLMTFVCVFFGPVLCVRYVPTLDAAIPFLNTNPFGNGAAVFTRSGAVAQRFEMEVEAGQIEVNVLIPVPLPMFSWTGNEVRFPFISVFGIKFYTQITTTTTLWRSDDA